MIEKIKEYTSNPSELSLCKELLKQFKSNTIINNIKNFNIDNINISNFCNIQNIDYNFKKNILVTGNREQGKSLFAESILWGLTNNCRTSTQVSGNNGNGTNVELSFKINQKKYRIKRQRKSATLDIFLYENGNNNPVADKNDIESKLNEIFNFDINYDKKIGFNLLNLFYFTPKLAFKFSEKLPNEIESFLIKLNNNDVWLELEQLAKNIKKSESERITEINGILSHIGMSQNESIDDIKNKIKILKEENKNYKQEIKSFEEPNIDELKIQIQDINNKISLISDYQYKIDNYIELKEEKDKLQKENKEYKLKLNKSVINKNIMHQWEENNKKLEEEKLKVVSDGKIIKSKIEEIDKLLNSKDNICPIIKIKCGTLKDYKIKLKEQIDVLQSKRKKLVEKYNNINSKQESNKEEYVKSYELEKINTQINNAIQDNDDRIKSIDNDLKIDIKVLKSKIKEIGNEGKLKSEKEKLENQYSNFSSILSEQSKQKIELNNKINENTLNIDNYNKIVINYNDYTKYVADKEKLEERQISFESLIKLFGKKGIPKSESSKSLRSLNKNMNYFLNEFSSGTIVTHINDSFKIDVSVKNIGKKLTPKLVSDGQEMIINLSFVLACCLLASNKKIPFFVCDDCFAYQNDEDSNKIIKSFIKFRDENYIDQLILISNRKSILEKYSKKFDDYLVFNNGNIVNK